MALTQLVIAVEAAASIIVIIKAIHQMHQMGFDHL